MTNPITPAHTCSNGDDAEWCARGCPRNEPCRTCDLLELRNAVKRAGIGEGSLARLAARIAELEAELVYVRDSRKYNPVWQRLDALAAKTIAAIDAEPARELAPPVNADDERLIDELCAKREAGLRVTPMREVAAWIAVGATGDKPAMGALVVVEVPDLGFAIGVVKPHWRTANDLRIESGEGYTYELSQCSRFLVVPKPPLAEKDAVK